MINRSSKFEIMKNIYAYFCLFTLIFSCNLSEKTGSNMKIKYPVTREDDITDNYFGTEVADPYRWLEDDLSTETAAWVKQQNTVTEKYLSQIPFRAAIHKRCEVVFNYERFAAPFSEGEYYYYFYNSGLQNQPVLYREKKSGGDKEVFLDPNTFSSKGTTSISEIKFSLDGSLVAYNISEGGSDWQRIVVLNTISGKQVDDTLNYIKFGSARWKGNGGFFYTTYKKPENESLLSGLTDHHFLYYHKLGTPQSDDVIYFGNEHKRRYLGASVSEDSNWLIITATNATYGNELYTLDLRDSQKTVRTFAATASHGFNFIYSDENYFYFETDKNAKNKQLIAVPHNYKNENDFKIIIPETNEVASFSAAGGYIFASYLENAISVVKQYDLKGNYLRTVNLPTLGTATGFSAKQNDKELFFSFTSYINPTSVYRMDLTSGETTLYKSPKIKFDPSAYISKQVFYTSKDGTKVPMIITYKKGLLLNGKNPTLLYGYGGFNVSLTPAFRASNIILMENGGIFAVANLRGGGEYGQKWHESGTKLQKQNVFDDFIAAANYLKEKNYTSTEYLAIEGGSNGGLLVGVTITQQPQICKVAFPAVGVLDMLRYHKFTSGAGWAYDYGTSEDNREMFEYLKNYSPLHNVKPAKYPATLITTADHDDRVVPAHSFKFAATLQKNQQGTNPVLIKIQIQAGHGAGISTMQAIDQAADKWSFMFFNMNIKPQY